MEPIMGTVIMFAGKFAPRGWAFCKGQLLPISENYALYSLIGTIYGGDGRLTFGLPDLQGRVPLSQGQGARLSSRPVGQKGGSETTTMTTLNMPLHFHLIIGEVTVGVNEEDPDTEFSSDGKTLGNTSSGNILYNAASVGENEKLAGVSHNITTLPMGNGQPYDNMQPYLAVNYIIALHGIFPSRS